MGYGSSIVTCETCGTDFRRPNHRIKRSDNQFCSRDCVHEYQRENHPKDVGAKQKFDCTYCGKTFERYRSTVTSENVYCSKKCSTDDRRRDDRKRVECKICSEEIIRYTSENKNYFCSPKCQGTFLEKSHTKTYKFYTSSKWKSVREEVIEYDNHNCQSCGKEERLEVHHIIPMSHGGALFKKNNLITLCKTCHAKVHVKIDKTGNEHESIVKMIGGFFGPYSLYGEDD